MSLKLYHQKRDFKKTAEPKGKTGKKRKSSLLYVIQKHAASHLHYDLRLELNGVLLSWAVPKGPCLDPAVKRLAMHVEDHPIEYGNFEGIIPQGEYGGGTVMLWDEGTWESEADNPTLSYKKGDLSFRIKGKKLKGVWKLIQIKKSPKSWLLIKGKDQYAKPLADYDITLEKPNSVLSKQTIAQITENFTKVWGKEGLKKKSQKKPISQKKKPNKKLNVLKHLTNLPKSSVPHFIFPELATLVTLPPSGEQWLHEIKFDGYRIIAIKKKGKTLLFTRNQNNWTEKFSSVATEIDLLPIDNLIVDGEVVVLDDKQLSNFQLLQNSIKTNTHKPFIYYVFDMIYVDQYDLTSLPLLDRKKILANVIQSFASPILRYSDHVIGSGKEVLKKACKLNLEGIVSKKIDSLYEQKRTKSWLKTKCSQRQEFVIGGFTPPSGSRKFFGSLYLGTYDDKMNLIYRGNVGTGFTEQSLKELYQKFIKLKTTKMPFTQKPPGYTTAIWLQPKLVGEVAFSEWTTEGILRHPSFKGLRMDKPAKKISREIPIKKIASSKQNFSIKLSNPSKIYYPEDKITKLAVAEYYEQIHSWILPYITDRPLSLVRCPENYKSCFFQKHFKESRPDGIFEFADKLKKEKWIYIQDKMGLASLCQLGVLEIHPWGSKIDNLNHPDIIIFDLDPAPDVPWKKVVKSAFAVREILENLSLSPFVKTTGGKGLHVIIPIKPEYTWEQIKIFSHTLVSYLVQTHPLDYVSKMTKKTRESKIFIDYLRNVRGATAIAPYSTRARIHAPVATPVHWDELTNNIADTSYTIKTVVKRLEHLKKDPWKNFHKKQSLHLDKLI